MSDKTDASARKRPPDRKKTSSKAAKAAVRPRSQKELPLKVEDSAARVTSNEEHASVSVAQSANKPVNDETVSTATTEQPTASPAAQPDSQPAPRKRRVLDIFLIDSGWNNEVGTAVRENLPVFAGYLQGQRFYVLSREQSQAFISKHPSTVGADPILIVLDREAAEQKSPKGYGFRLCLGHIRNAEAAISMMKWAIQLTMASNGPEMSEIVKKSGHRQTIQGTIELIGEGSTHLLEFAPV